MTTFFASIFVFGLLIFFHELGHLIAAKRADIKVDEFAIGMGPKVFSKQMGETLYSFRLLPLGGFIKMAGMDPEDMDNERGFNKKTVLQRMIVIASGPIMNFVLAILLFASVFVFIGDPVMTTEVGNVLPNKPAYEAGLQKGDIITEVNGEEVQSWQELVAQIHSLPNEQVTLTVLRDNQVFEVAIVPELDPNEGIGLIGIESTGVIWETKGVIESFVLAVTQTGELTVFILLAIGQMVTGQIAADVSGPVGIVQAIGNTAKVGIPYLLHLAAIISIHLGLLNLLPIPALDGSRLVFLLIEAIRRKPLAPEKENFVHLIGFALLILLVIVVTFKDITRIFS